MSLEIEVDLYQAIYREMTTTTYIPLKKTLVRISLLDSNSKCSFSAVSICGIREGKSKEVEIVIITNHNTFYQI